MTIIAFTENFGYPVLLGDILVTARDTFAETAPALPTAPEGVRIDGFPKVKLRKKLYVINDRLAVGLAGELTEAARFLQALRGRFQQRVGHSEIQSFIDEYDFSPNGHPGVMLVLAEPDGERTAFRVSFRASNVVEASTEFSGQLVAIGSGAQSVVDALGGMQTTARKPPSSLGEGLIRVVQAVAHLLADEMGGQERTRDEGWGAGYEVVFFADDRFQKLPSATFAVWLREESHFSPKRIVTYRYDSEDRLVMHAMGSPGVVPFVAIGIDEAGGYQLTLEPPNFVADVMAHVYVAQADGQTYKLAVVFSSSEDRIILRVVNDKLEILQAQSFEADVRRRLAAHVAAARAKR